MIKFSEEQVEFCQGRGIREQITNPRMLMQKAREHQQSLHTMCFVDFKKAFHSISYDKFWVTMMDIVYPLHMIDLLAKLYTRNGSHKVEVPATLSEWFRVRKGVRQGCVFLRTCSSSQQRW